MNIPDIHRIGCSIPWLLKDIVPTYHSVLPCHLLYGRIPTCMAEAGYRQIQISKCEERRKYGGGRPTLIGPGPGKLCSQFAGLDNFKGYCEV
jgi:hypothetical protein